MAGIAGRKTRVKICTTSGGTYNNVLGIRQTTPTMDGVVVDDSEFGSEWAQKLSGLRNFKLSLSGNRRPADATGQNLLLEMFTEGTPATIFVQFLPDNGVTPDVGVKCEMILVNLTMPSSVDGAVEFSCELEGAGTPEVI